MLKFLVEKSIGAQITCGNYELLAYEPNKLVYKRHSNFTTGGSSDEFTVSIVFKEQNNGNACVVVSMQSWIKNDGISHRAGIEAMRTSYYEIIESVTSVSPNPIVEYSDGTAMPGQQANTSNAKIEVSISASNYCGKVTAPKAKFCPGCGHVAD